MLPFVFIVLGIVMLYVGGELLVRSVLRLAVAFHTSTLVIGLTVVAFGTSSPEVAVVVRAGLSGSSEIALGNVLGSNSANLGLILGLAVLFAPIVAKDAFRKRDLPFIAIVSIALVPLVWVLGLGRATAVVLLAALIGYMWRLLKSGHDELESEVPDRDARPGDGLRGILGAVAALALLIYGASVLVDASISIARDIGISERVIGLTLVAFGTSLPELAGCLAAAARRQGDIVLGNVIGSNIFNTLFVLPIALLVRPAVVTSSDWIDMGVVVFFTLLTFVFLFHRRRMYRFEGLLFLGAYVAYIGWLFVGG